MLESLQCEQKKNLGPTEIWTRIAGFKVQSANHYTMGPSYFATKIYEIRL